MAKKEGTNDKIIRLFKTGMTINDIAKDVGMLPDQVRHVIENRIPNYLEFDPKAEQSSQIKHNGGFFKKKHKIDVTLGKDGFISDQTKAIAELLAKNESYEKIAGIFNISIADIAEVDSLKETHFRRYFTSFPDKKLSVETPKAKHIADEEPKIELIPQVNKQKLLSPVNEPKKIETIKPDKPKSTPIVTTETSSDVNLEGKSNAYIKMRTFANNQIAEDENKISTIETSIKDYTVKADEITIVINNNKTKKDVLLEQLESIKNQIEQIDTELTTHQNEFNEYNAYITKLTKERDTLNEEIRQFKSMSF